MQDAIIRRLKLFAFYQLMAFHGLFKPKDAEHMIEVAQEGDAARAIKLTHEAVFSRAQRIPSQCNR